MAHTIVPGDRLPLHQEIQAMQLMALPVLHSSFKKSEDTLLCDLMILIQSYIISLRVFLQYNKFWPCWKSLPQTNGRSLGKEWH